MERQTKIALAVGLGAAVIGFLLWKRTKQITDSPAEEKGQETKTPEAALSNPSSGKGNNPPKETKETKPKELKNKPTFSWEKVSNNPCENH